MWVGVNICVNKYVGIVFSDMKRQTVLFCSVSLEMLGTIADRFHSYLTFKLRRVSLSQSIGVHSV